MVSQTIPFGEWAVEQFFTLFVSHLQYFECNVAVPFVANAINCMVGSKNNCQEGWMVRRWGSMHLLDRLCSALLTLWGMCLQGNVTAGGSRLNAGGYA